MYHFCRGLIAATAMLQRWGKHEHVPLLVLTAANVSHSTNHDMARAKGRCIAAPYVDSDHVLGSDAADTAEAFRHVVAVFAERGFTLRDMVECERSFDLVGLSPTGTIGLDGTKAHGCGPSWGSCLRGPQERAYR